MRGAQRGGAGGVRPGAVAKADDELAKRARLRPVVIPKDLPAEPQYRPSAGLARFLRCRDMGCRWPNCNAPAEVCDIDHTTPYPLGPSHPSNCKLYCRLHPVRKSYTTAKRCHSPGTPLSP